MAADIKFFPIQDMPHASAVRGSGVTGFFPRHVHGSLILGLVDKGERTISFEDKAVRIPAGSIFVISPGQAHSCSWNRIDHAYRVISIKPEYVQSVAAQISREIDPASCMRERPMEDEDGQMREGIERFFELIERKSSLLERETILLSLVSLLVIMCPAQARPARIAAPREAVLKARNFIKDNYSRVISLESVADSAGLSPFHFQRVFLRETGNTPHEYLLQLRVKHGRELLDNGASLSDAALAAGFADQSHFSRSFKKVMGLPPGRYKKLNT